jgi:hypothetical protein
MKKFATIILISTSWCIDVAAQSLLNQNAGNVFDHNIVFHNPPGIAYAQGIQGMVGMQWLYAGISENSLRNTIAYFVYPLDENNAFGLRAIHFSSHLLQQGAVSLLFGHKFLDDRLSLGFNANVLYFAYDRDKFQEFDFNDPVIANGTAKNVLSFGAGFLLWLSEMLAVGFSIDDLNQPNIALGNAEFKKDVVYKLGTVYLHPLLSPQFDMQLDGREVSFQAGAHRNFLDKKVDLFAGYTAAGSEGGALLFEIGFMPGTWGLSYNFRYETGELGQVSNGSHFLTLRFNKAGSPTVFAKPVIKLNNPEWPIVKTEFLIISGEASSSAGITLVEYRNNGKVVQTHPYDQKLKKVPLWFPMPLDEDENEIEVVAHAGKRRSSKTIRVTFDPIVLPPRIAFFPTDSIIVYAPSYRLYARIDDPRGLQSLRVLVNGEERTNLSFTDWPKSHEIDESVDLLPGQNVIEIIAANDKAKSAKAVPITYRSTEMAVAPPEIFILSPEKLSKVLSMKTPHSLVRLEWEVKNVESLADVNLKANGSLLSLSTNEVTHRGENSFMLRKDINLNKGQNIIEVHAHRGGHHVRTEMNVFYNPFLEERHFPYRKTWAIIIGINKYRDPAIETLELAVHDAIGVARTLQEQFEFDRILTLYDDKATKERIVATLFDSLKNTHPDDGVFLFFASHGDTIMTGEGEVGYLVPHDGKWKSYADNIPITMIQDAAKLTKAKHVFFVIDACFSGLLFVKRSGMNPPSRDADFDSLRVLATNRARNALTAGGPNEKVLDGGLEYHSLFTGRFLEGLREKDNYFHADYDKDSYVTAYEISYYVKEKVPQDAQMRNAQQNPRSGDLTPDDGQFIFVRKNR